jgi:hypothetical protein
MNDKQQSLAYCNCCNKDVVLTWKKDYKISDGYKKWFYCKICNNDNFTFRYLKG